MAKVAVKLAIKERLKHPHDFRSHRYAACGELIVHYGKLKSGELKEGMRGYSEG